MEKLNSCLIDCKRCERLVHFRENVPEKKQLEGTYWKRPVPGFGDPNAHLLILGLAPSAQGGNRTGRIFTGDESARFLFKALHAEGFASQPTSENLGDKLQLQGCYLTAAVKCVPPDNKPTAVEQKHCFSYLENEFFLLKKVKTVLALGGFAFNAYLQYVRAHGGPKATYTENDSRISPGLRQSPGVELPASGSYVLNMDPLARTQPQELSRSPGPILKSFSVYRFQHGQKYSFEGFPDLYTCYHPSPQNTNTGKLNQEMIRAVLKMLRSA